MRPGPAEPQVPAKGADDKAWATYVSNLLDWGLQGWAQSAAQSAWIESAPK